MYYDERAAHSTAEVKDRPIDDRLTEGILTLQPSISLPREVPGARQGEMTRNRLIIVCDSLIQKLFILVI